MKPFHIVGLATVLVCIVVCGCAKNYVIIQDLEQRFPLGEAAAVSEITDQLPADTDMGDRPTLEHMQKFKVYLMEQLEKRDLLRVWTQSEEGVLYTIRGSIIEFKRGSGVVRALIGFGAGNAKVTCNLELIDNTTAEVIFSGNFTQTVSSYAESGDKTFERVAEEFAKQLEKQWKKLPG